MLGRALFAFVWLLIGAGLLLPAFQASVTAPTLPAVELSRAASKVVAAECVGCKEVQVKPSFCAHATAGTPAHPDHPANTTVRLLIWSTPIEVRPMPPRLPSV
jgi:hypothetical protein